VATITAYDAQGFGLGMDTGKLTAYPDGKEHPVTSSSDSTESLGNSYYYVTSQLRGNPYLDVTIARIHIVNDVSYVLDVRFFNDDVLVLSVKGISLTFAQLATGNAVLCAKNDVIYGNRYSDTIGGYAGDDRLFGRAGDDFMAGGFGNDMLFGGAGNDTLYGGVGNDRFVFNARPAADNIDAVKDFQLGIDRLVLDDDLFTRLGTGTTAGRALQAAHYRVSASAADANDFILYNPRTDKLFYDDDGNGPHAPVLIASISMSGNTAPSASDFLVVS